MPISSLRISGSGLTAERTRLDTIARNIANAQTTRTEDGGPYRRQLTIFESIPASESEAGGVRISEVIPSTEEMVKVHNPSHPHADANGDVTMPNVNIVQEMVDMVAATRAYEANTGVAHATKSMISRAIELGRP
jgi:flagellar basal-body rod protein FlgC